MADWYGAARSNFFRVKDEARFDEWAYSINNVEVFRDDRGRVGILSNDEFGHLPYYKYDSETEEVERIDLVQEVASHLQEGSVAVFMEVGAEKLRYLTGYACAVNSQGQTVTICLDDIYELAKSLGNEVTVAEY